MIGASLGISLRWRVAFVVLSLLLGPFAAAEEIQLGVAPLNTTQAGFSMFVVTERLGNEGFQPITLRFQSFGNSFTSQRLLHVVFRPRTQYATEIDFQFSVDVTVPQGVKNHDAQILVPHFYRWESCSVQIFEDGRRLGKAASRLTIPNSVKDWGQHMSIGVMVPRDADTSGAAWAVFPDLRSIVTVLGDGPIDDNVKDQRLSGKESRKYVEDLFSSWARFRIIDEDVLQDSWIGYSQLDLIIAPYPVLQRVALEQPERLVALQNWVAAGGQLWAYAAPVQSAPSTSSTTPDAAATKPSLTSTPDAASAPDVSSWLRGDPSLIDKEMKYLADPSVDLMLEETNDTSAIEYQPWNYGTYYSNSYSYGSNAEKKRKLIYEDLVAAKHPMVQTLPRSKLAADLNSSRYGLGRIVLIAQQDPFPGSIQLWKSLEIDKQNWGERNGVDYSTGNDSYWAWLMATVGQPPVTMFVILNGLFVVIMGPVLYFTLRRRRRLYLLYFLAPALALLATMGLFLYAFLSDGFDNRARIRQLTWIDGRHTVEVAGDASPTSHPIVDQSRQTYYTVVDNQRGLRFDSDSFVLPVHHSEMMNTYNYYSADDSRSGEYLIDQVASERVYTGDFLPTRTQVHYLVTRPRSGACPIRASFDADGVTITNELSTPLSAVSVCDEQGKYWTANDVAAGASVLMQPAKSNALAEIALRGVDPSGAEMPTPYQNRVSMNDRTAFEERMLEFTRKPPPRSFIAETSVEPSQFALRECLEDDCLRLIGGLLP